MIYNSIGLIFIISAFILLIYSYLVMPRCYLKPKKYKRVLSQSNYLEYLKNLQINNEEFISDVIGEYHSEDLTYKRKIYTRKKED